MHYSKYTYIVKRLLFKGFLHRKNVVCYTTLRSANHTVIKVANTTQCHMVHQLVWYAHFIFYTVKMWCVIHQLVWYAHFIRHCGVLITL